MKEIKEDVLEFWEWGRKNYPGEEIEFLLWKVESSINNLNRYINNEFKRQAMGKNDGLRTK